MNITRKTQGRSFFTGLTTAAILLLACYNPAMGWTLSAHKQTSWEKLGSHQSILSTVEQKRFESEVKRLLKHKKYLLRLAKRAAPYLQYILQEAREHHVPAELALLPMVESRFQPFSFSQKGATGLWQMMPGTASGYGLSLDWWYDARRDTVASTRAALGYLSYLHHYFHDWLLAIAAYNAGEGRILKAIHENVRKHHPVDYWSLRLPKQTREYVPTFLAYVEIFSHPARYQLDMQPLDTNLRWKSVELPGPMHLSQVASMAGISVATLRTYNPGYRRDVTGPHYLSVLIPKYAMRRMQQRLEALKRNDKPLADWKHYSVHKGDSLSKLAKTNHTTPSLIKYVNHLHGDVLKLHQHLYIPQHKKQLTIPIKASISDVKINKKIVSEATLPGPKQIHYLVRPGDTRKRVARRFHVKEAQLIYWNGLGWNDPLIPGQHLNLWHKPSRYHRIVHHVKPGESLSVIAKRYQTTVTKLKRRNGLKNNKIRIGKQLVI
jgi:membrane-bound lytic murein transglycosylase D